MLEQIPKIWASERVHRFANIPDLDKLARERGLDDKAIDDLFEFVGPAEKALDPNELLDAPFHRKRSLNKPWWPSRFTDGQWPVFYGALEEETAKFEMAYHLKDGNTSSLLGHPNRQRAVFFTVFSCRFESDNARDLRPKVGEWTELVDPQTDNTFCQRLGREAKEIGTGGFLTVSARKTDGTAVPVFVRETLSDPTILRVAMFKYDATSGEIAVSYAA